MAKNPNWWSTGNRLRQVAEEIDAMRCELQRLDPDPEDARLADKPRQQLVEDFRRIIAEKDRRIAELEDKLTLVFTI